jgi:hypothetical protein
VAVSKPKFMGANGTRARHAAPSLIWVLNKFARFRVVVAGALKEVDDLRAGKEEKGRGGRGTSGRHLEGNGPTEQGQGGLLGGEGSQEKGRHTSPPLVIAAEGVCRC